jgi:hypothetical protein
MGWWSRFFESFSFGVTDHQALEDERCFSGGPFDSDSLLGLGSDCINPATGLPMIGGCGGVVAAGNVFGSSDDFSWSGANGLDDSFHSASLHDCCFNPATGLPMVDGCGGVDVGGNLYGTSDDTWSSIDDSWHSSSSFIFDD